MEFNLGIILATIVNFLILFFGLKYFFFEKVKLIVEARENEISYKLDSADEELEKARTLAINNERELQRAREEGKAITETCALRSGKLLQRDIRKKLKKYMMKLLKRQNQKQI